MIEKLLRGVVSQKEVLIYYNANITYKLLPIKIHGFVFNYKGINNIIINKNLSYYKRKKTLIHELAHLELNHLCQADRLFQFNIDKFEDDADKYIKFLIDNCK